jgi:hypothetical protein
MAAVGILTDRAKMKLIKQFIFILTLLISSETFSQQPLFATISGGDLYSFSLANCKRHFIGSTGQGFGDIALTPNGNLWGIINGQLYHIDTSTANATLVGITGVQSNNLVALNDSILLTESELSLYGLNINNLSSYLIGYIGYGASGDLTWYDEDLYMITPLVKITLNNSYTAILSVTPISMTMPTCEGAVTASFDGDYNSIVGFNGSNLIKVCQIDGSFQMLCPSLNIGGTPGGASIRLATQVSQPTLCTMTGIQNIFENDFFSIFPNPTSKEINIRTDCTHKFNFKIYNSFGQLVTSGTSETNFTIVDIKKLTNGIYSIAVSACDKTERKNFIVEK